MTTNYEEAAVYLADAKDATSDAHAALDAALAQVHATLAVADLIRQGQQDAQEMFKQTRVDAGLEVDALTERQLDAETTAMFTVHPEDREQGETETTERIVSGAIWGYLHSRARVDPNAVVDVRATITRLQLVDAIVKALVGGEAEQPETASDIANAFNAEVFADADRKHVISDALGPVIDSTLTQARGEYLEQMTTAVHDALVAAKAYREADAEGGASPLAARLASMAAPCQLVMDVLSQYGVHDDGPYGDQGRMTIAIAVAGALMGTDVEVVDVRVDRARAALAATYGGYCNLQEISEDIVRALAEGRTS